MKSPLTGSWRSQLRKGPQPQGAGCKANTGQEGVRLALSRPLPLIPELPRQLGMPRVLGGMVECMGQRPGNGNLAPVGQPPEPNQVLKRKLLQHAPAQLQRVVEMPGKLRLAKPCRLELGAAVALDGLLPYNLADPVALSACHMHGQHREAVCFWARRPVQPFRRQALEGPFDHVVQFAQMVEVRLIRLLHGCSLPL